MSDRLPEGPVSIVFTDIEGATALRVKLGDQASQRIFRHHNKVIRDRVARFEGVELQALGDGFMLGFASARKALACAVEIQKAFSGNSSAASDATIRVRIGINTGDVLREGGTIGGEAVHGAARVMAKAKGGEILISEVVKQLAGTIAGLSFQDRGRQALKGFPQRWRLFEVTWSEQSESDAAPLRVLLADDHPLWRETLRKVLEHKRVASVVAEASDGEEAVRLARETKPDVIVMDVDLPLFSGVDATRQIVADTKGSKVLMLSASAERSQVLKAVRAGASGYLVKTAASTEVADAVRRIGGGEVVFPPELSGVILEELRNRTPAGLRLVVTGGSLLRRKGLIHLLGDAGFEITASGPTTDLRAMVEQHAPDVAVVDAALGPEMDLVQALRESHPGLSLVVLSEEARASSAVGLLSETSHALGYLRTDRIADLDTLSDAIRRVAAGESVVDPDVVSSLVDRSNDDTLSRLSERERTVLALMAEGRSNQAIADQLFISPKTVEARIAGIFSKLGLEPAADDHRRIRAVLVYLRSL